MKGDNKSENKIPECGIFYTSPMRAIISAYQSN
jgi:hypothetical protein